MAVNTDEYKRFKAIQANNESIANGTFQGMNRKADGWYAKTPAANAVLGGKPLLKAGGLGATVLDAAATEPKPKTAGQAVLKAAGQWKPLNDHYANYSAGGSDNRSGNGRVAEGGAFVPSTASETVPMSTATGEQIVGEDAPIADERLQQAQVGRGDAIPVESTVKPKTYNVNGRQMTMGEYIKAIGADPQAQYRQAMAAANANYDRERATYGAEAEALASAGLARSGSSQYADQQAYAAKQKAASEASQLRAQQEAQLGAQYMSYRQQEQAEYDAKVQSAIERAAAMQLNEANTVKYLMAMTGMTKSEAEGYAKGNQAIVGEQDDTAKMQEITNTYLSLIKSKEEGGMGLSLDAAKEYLKGGTFNYDGALVDQAVGEYTAAQTETEEANKAEMQKAVADTIDSLYNDAYSGTDIQQALAKVGVNLEVSEDGDVEHYAVRDAITEAYNKGGQITEADYQRLHRKNIDSWIEQAKADKKLGDLLQAAVGYSGDAGLEKYAMEAIKKNLSPNYRIEERDFGKDPVLKVSFNFNGRKQTVTFSMTAINSDIPDYVSKLKGEAGDVTVYNGKLYGYIATGRNQGYWKEVTDTKVGGSITQEQMTALYNTLTSGVNNYYKGQ